MKKFITTALLVFSTTSVLALDTQQQVTLAMYTQGTYNGCMMSVVQLSVQWDKIKDSNSIHQLHNFCLQMAKVESIKSKLDSANFKILMDSVEEIRQGAAAWLLTQSPKAHIINKGK